ncbi:MAG: hypothetical protein JWP97_3466 [Labilithrix sp.]|nr:hypothetical protein [Labilithrix sp.]
MQRRSARIGFLLATIGAAVAACSSSEDAAAPDDHAADAAPDVRTDASAGPQDAAVPLPPGHGVSVENVKTAESCAAVCSAHGFACGSTTCESLGAVLGVVAYVGGTSTDVTSCTDRPPATNGAAKLARVDCCCITPFVVVDGPKSPTSCTDVCTAAGVVCDDQHAWAAGKGGLDAQYERPSTTAVTDYALPCSKVPTATIPLTKPTEKGTLTKYGCACVAP